MSPSWSIRRHPLASHPRRSAFICGSFSSAAFSILAANARGEDATDPRVPEEIAALDRDTQAAWRSFSTRFSGHGGCWGGVYYILYDYDRRYDSSAKLAAAQIERDRTHMVQQGLKTLEVKPPKAEVDAACELLPALDIGSYGRVHQVTVA